MVKKGADTQASAMSTTAVSYEPYDLPQTREVFFVISMGRAAIKLAGEALPAPTG
jgi:hypothetical protein